MARSAVWFLMLGLVLSVTTVYAQEEEEVKRVRFEPAVQVLSLEQSSVKVAKPGAKEATTAVCYKAYPYGSVFTVPAGVKFRLSFGDLTTAFVRGPAKFTPLASDGFRKVVLNVEQGDINFSVDTNALPGQFTVVTPMGSFTSLKGTSRLHVGDLTKGEIDDDEFSFRTLAGSAVFNGINYEVKEMGQAAAFRAADDSFIERGKQFRFTRLTGVAGDVQTVLPKGEPKGEDKTLTFALTQGAVVKITRAKHPGSDNWVVSVLTLYGNGKAQNYFCYVEGRGEGYATGDLLSEVLPGDEELGEDSEEGNDDDSGLSGNGLDDFGDDDLL